MNPTPASILHDEHIYILKVVNACKKISELLNRGNEVKASLLFDIVEFMREFADKCHHGKEEDILFHAMIKAGVPAEGCPISALLHEHVQGRNSVAALQVAAVKYAEDNSRSGDVISALNKIHQLYPSHIWKEDEMVFPMENRIFSSEEMSDIVNAFERVESGIGFDMHNKFKKFAENISDYLILQEEAT